MTRINTYSQLLTNIAVNVKKFRVEKRWSRLELALGADISVQTVGAMERGYKKNLEARNISIKTLSLVADALEVNIKELMKDA